MASVDDEKGGSTCVYVSSSMGGCLEFEDIAPWLEDILSTAYSLGLEPGSYDEVEFLENLEIFSEEEEEYEGGPGMSWESYAGWYDGTPERAEKDACSLYEDIARENLGVENSQDDYAIVMVESKRGIQVAPWFEEHLKKPARYIKRYFEAEKMLEGEEQFTYYVVHNYKHFVEEYEIAHHIGGKTRPKAPRKKFDYYHVKFGEVANRHVKAGIIFGDSPEKGNPIKCSSGNLIQWLKDYLEKIQCPAEKYPEQLRKLGFTFDWDYAYDDMYEEDYTRAYVICGVKTYEKAKQRALKRLKQG